MQVHPVGFDFEPNYFAEHFEDVLKRYSYLNIVKFEVVCADKDAEKFVTLIHRAAHTGAPGDGIIFITEVLSAVRIRDGVCDEEAFVARDEV